MSFGPPVAVDRVFASGENAGVSSSFSFIYTRESERFDMTGGEADCKDWFFGVKRLGEEIRCERESAEILEHF